MDTVRPHLTPDQRPAARLILVASAGVELEPAVVLESLDEVTPPALLAQLADVAEQLAGLAAMLAPVALEVWRVTAAVEAAHARVDLDLDEYSAALDRSQLGRLGELVTKMIDMLDATGRTDPPAVIVAGVETWSKSADAVAEHLTTLHTRNLRPATIAQRHAALRRLAEHAHPTPLLELGLAELTAWTSRPALSIETQASEISHVRSFYRWAHAAGLVDHDPAAQVQRPQVPRRHPQPVDRAEVLAAIEQAPDRVRPWLSLAAYAGLRCHEIAQLRREDLLTHQDAPMLVAGGHDGQRRRLVPVDQVLAAELETLPPAGWLFPRRDGQPGPVPAHLVSQLTNGYQRRAGITATMHEVRDLSLARGRGPETSRP